MAFERQCTDRTYIPILWLMKPFFFCIIFGLFVMVMPHSAYAGNPDPNNVLMKEYGRYRSYTGNKPTTRSITNATKEYRQWLGNGWRDYAASLRQRALMRRADRHEKQHITAPMTTRERTILYRQYRTRSPMRDS